MPLSTQTLDTLEREYSRLLAEVTDAVATYRRRLEEAQSVADLLLQSGRSVIAPTDALDLPRVNDDTPKELDDSALDNLIVKHVMARESGFKPSEMYRRLSKTVPDGDSLAKRVVERMAYLEREGILRRVPPANRYQPAFNAPQNFQEDEDLPF